MGVVFFFIDMRRGEIFVYFWFDDFIRLFRGL